MGVITQLSEQVANQIAAGEVVERPASVVKELLENAIDAGATRVQIEIEDGGTTLIRVSDDGVGMERDDAALCLSRHATSKLTSAEDLSRISSLGFRGEAIPSIASVSRFRLITHSASSGQSTLVRVAGGKDVEVSDYGAAPGTVVEVKDLFYNVPARKKFLKRPATEVSHINDVVVRVALAQPQIGLRLRNGNRVTWDIPIEQTQDPRGRLSRILGEKVAKQLYPLEETRLSEQLAVKGWCGAPALSERTTKGLYCFVNGRFVRDRTVQHAVQESYRTMMERGRYPVVVLFLTIEPTEIDVNVHPQKTEVRFADTSLVHRTITRALGRCLAGQPWASNMGYSHIRLDELSSEGSVVSDSGMSTYSASAPAFSKTNSTVTPAFDSSRMYSESFDRSTNTGRKKFEELSAETNQDWVFVSGEGQEGQQQETLKTANEGVFSGLKPVGQIHSTYLVCEGSDKMVMIDQHAAHERIAFQKMLNQFKSAQLETQPLLFPLEVELTSAQSEIARSMQKFVESSGFKLVERERGWQVMSVPAVLAGGNHAQMVVDILDELALFERTTVFEEKIESIFSCAACHTVVRAGDKLSPLEMSALLRQMDEIDFGTLCPHGRPVFIEWSKNELEKWFHRK